MPENQSISILKQLIYISHNKTYQDNLIN